MKSGKTLVELATEIERQQKSKRDFIVDTSVLEMRVKDSAAEERGVPVLAVTNGKVLEMPLKPYAHHQIAARLDIPRQYYDRMLADEPALLAKNVNTWLRTQPERRMVRTLDGHVRAFLSDKFRPLENADLAEAVLPVLSKLDMQLLSCEITDTRIYIKAFDKSMTKDIPTGRKMGDGSHAIFDTLSPAIVISNSEVGAGALSVEAAIWTRACTNMAIFAQHSMRKYHVGARADIGEEMYALLSDSTKRVTDASVWMQVQDIIKGAMERTRFEALADQLAGVVQDKIDGDPVKVIEVMGKQFRMSDGERGSVLKHLIEGGELSRYGLFNAVTRTAEDLSNYDRSTEFEKMGGQLIELPRNDWQRIAEAGKIAVAA